VGFGGPSTGTRARHGLCELDPTIVTTVVPPVIALVVTTIVMSIVAHLSDLPYVTTFANCFINGSSGSPTQSNENAATAAAGIVDGTAARAARSLGHPELVSEVSIRSQASAMEPRLVEKFASLHVEAYRYETGLTQSVG
jgi:hypothetical protein